MSHSLRVVQRLGAGHVRVADEVEKTTADVVTMDDELQFRKRYRGVIGVESKVPIRDRSVLSLVYTPGVAGHRLGVVPHLNLDR